jgi:hypothetical protein
MTIKISELANLTVTQANTIVPVVSNVTGTLTTVQANVQQLQTYMLENAGNLIPRAGNIYSIGSPTVWWKDLWLSANTFYIGGVAVSTSGGSLTFGGNVVGTSDLPSYTGNVSAGNIAVGATTVGNTTTAPTFSVEGTSGNITAGNITSTGDLATASVTTPTVTTESVTVGGSVDFVSGSVPAGGGGATAMISGGSGYAWGFLYYPSGGTGTGLSIIVQGVSYPSGEITGYTVYQGGSGYTVGDILTIDNAGEIPAVFQVEAVLNGGTMTSGESTWTFDPAGDTTLPGNITLPDNTAIYNVDANTAVFTSNVNGDATSLYLTDAGNVAVYASGSVVLETNSDGNVSQQWSFNDTGDIIFPNGATLRDGNAGQLTFGASAGRVSQSGYAVAIGGSAGEYNQGVGATSIGLAAGFNNQGSGTTAVGYNAGRLSQGNLAIAVGFDSGVDSQGQAAIAIGNNSGRKNQKEFSISIGYYAGNTSQGNNSVSIGYGAGYENQKPNAVSIGKNAGFNLQGLNAIAIGENAGYNAQANNSIIINATGSELNLTTANALVVAPVRNDTGNITNSMYYNTTTKEVTYAPSYGNAQVSTYLPSYSGNIASVTVSGQMAVFGNVFVGNTYVPTLANSTGIAGQITWNANYVYICIAANTWKRANISTW